MDQIVAQAQSPGSNKAAPAPQVAHFRQILLWPVRLIELGDAATHDHAELFVKLSENAPWQEVSDEITGDPSQFQERHYNEFVTFLPPVQRFIYGAAIGKKIERTCGDSPIKVMRRNDIAAVRVTLDKGAVPVVLKIAHVDLYFYFDIDVAMLALEIYANDIPLPVAQDVMFRLGRAYPAFWHSGNDPGHCPWSVEWLGTSGEVLAKSDFEERSKFLAHVGQHRAARVGAHWEYLLKPMIPHYSDLPGALRYRQLEYYRMPQMAFLAIEGEEELARSDYVRLAFAYGPGERDRLPYSTHHLADFESKFCYDRYHEMRKENDWPATRFMTCGHTFVVTGTADNALFLNNDYGVLNSFRHQYFLLFMIAHFHKSALLMFSDRLAEAVNRLDLSDPQAVKSFRLATRDALETFLRFTHRYWFHSVSNHEDAHALFALCRKHLDVDELYADIQGEVQDMSQFLENEAMRRQNDSVMRLTVVTAFGLIGTVATGFLGMNLFDHTGFSTLQKIGIFALVFVPTMILTIYTIVKSQRLSAFLDALANEELDLRGKTRAFRDIWRQGASIRK